MSCNYSYHLLAPVLSVVLGMSLVAYAESAQERRLLDSIRVLEEILGEGTIRQELLDNAECVVVIPSAKAFSFLAGGSYGRGAMVCRSGEDFSGPWGPPAMYKLGGASFGLQFGWQATDYVLLVMDPQTTDLLIRGKFKLRARAAVVAGSRHLPTMAGTDAYTRPSLPPVLTYSRSRGLFAGVSLEGSTLHQDSKANEKLYGRKISARQIVAGDDVNVPEAGNGLVDLLQHVSPGS